MRHPSWYGTSYPSLEDLEEFAESLGTVVCYGDFPAAAFYPDGPVIFVPSGAGPLATHWWLAHELGHLCYHRQTNRLMWWKREAKANQWAAAALIPVERIRAYRNASMDAFVGALSAHYEDLPMEDCPARRMAGRIAKIRLNSLEVT